MFYIYLCISHLRTVMKSFWGSWKFFLADQWYLNAYINFWHFVRKMPLLRTLTFTSMLKNSTLRTESQKIMFDTLDNNDAQTSVIVTLASHGRQIPSCKNHFYRANIEKYVFFFFFFRCFLFIKISSFHYHFNILSFYFICIFNFVKYFLPITCTI